MVVRVGKVKRVGERTKRLSPLAGLPPFRRAACSLLLYLPSPSAPPNS